MESGEWRVELRTLCESGEWKVELRNFVQCGIRNAECGIVDTLSEKAKHSREERGLDCRRVIGGTGGLGGASR